MVCFEHAATVVCDLLTVLFQLRLNNIVVASLFIVYYESMGQLLVSMTMAGHCLRSFKRKLSF